MPKSTYDDTGAFVILVVALLLVFAGVLVVIRYAAKRSDRFAQECEQEGNKALSLGRYKLICITPDGRIVGWK